MAFRGHLWGLHKWDIVKIDGNIEFCLTFRLNYRNIRLADLFKWVWFIFSYIHTTLWRLKNDIWRGKYWKSVWLFYFLSFQRYNIQLVYFITIRRTCYPSNYIKQCSKRLFIVFNSTWPFSIHYFCLY